MPPTSTASGTSAGSGRCAHATGLRGAAARWSPPAPAAVHCSRPIKFWTSGCAARIAFRRATCHCAGVACANDAAAAAASIEVVAAHLARRRPLPRLTTATAASGHSAHLRSMLRSLLVFVLSASSEALKVTVVGGTGFVGTRVCKILAEKGAEVTSVSKSGTAPSEPWASSVTWKAVDLLGDSAALDAAMGSPDAIVSCMGASALTRRHCALATAPPTRMRSRRPSVRARRGRCWSRSRARSPRAAIRFRASSRATSTAKRRRRRPAPSVCRTPRGRRS